MMFRRCVFAVCYLAVAATSAGADSVGTVKICKKDAPQDYGDPAWWRKEVVVPKGAVFKDVGPIDDAGGEKIKLRVVVLDQVSLTGATKCRVTRAKIPSDWGDWGNAHVGSVVQHVNKSDQRLMEIERWGDSADPPSNLAPWDDVVSVEVTIETDFR